MAFRSGISGCCFTASAMALLLTGLVLFPAEAKSLRRSDFPKTFVFGASTSAYQYEGAVLQDGRGVDIWDVFAHEGYVMDGSNGDVTSDGYHRYKKDIKLLAEMGFDAFRFSVSWSRLLPAGRGEINPKGLEFYNSLINELIEQGIEPYLTINHFDLPQALEEEYGGWVNSRIVDDFLAYAEVCFREFGDRVKHWMTINEPNAYAQLGYSEGMLAPAHCSVSSLARCKKGNSSTEPYIAAHNMLLAHSAAVKLYRDKFQKKQGGLIGLTVLAYFYWPLTNKTRDIVACQRILDFHIGWIVEPLLYGRYPIVMQEIVGSRLPSFNESQKKDLINSFDFIGLNHYSTIYAADSDTKADPPTTYTDDLSVSTEVVDKGEDIPIHGNVGFGTVPLGLENLLEYMKQHYDNPPVVITECGYASSGNTSNSTVTMSQALNDTKRVTYFEGYLEHMLNALRNGSNASGFFAWSFVDGFEYALGYEVKFGLNHVNLSSDLNRQPKVSAEWFHKLLSSEEGLHLHKSSPSGVAWA